MNRRAVVVAFALALVVLVSPCLLSAESAAAEGSSAEAEVSVSQMRAELSAAGVDVSEMSDAEVALCWGWWANKNLVGEYSWDDFTGVNWLLDKAGVDETIDGLSVADDVVSLVVSDAMVLLAGATTGNIIGLMIEAGVMTVGYVYDSILQENALEKAELALELMAEQKDYAVYETTVMWNTIVNGYEVEECR